MSYTFKLKFKEKDYDNMSFEDLSEKFTDDIENFSAKRADENQAKLEQMLKDHFHATADRGFSDSSELFQLFNKTFKPGTLDWEFAVAGIVGKYLSQMLDYIVEGEIMEGRMPDSFLDRLLREGGIETMGEA